MEVFIMLNKVEKKLATMDRSYYRKLIRQYTQWYRSEMISGDDYARLIKEATEKISKDNNTIYSNM